MRRFALGVVGAGLTALASFTLEVAWRYRQLTAERDAELRAERLQDGFGGVFVEIVNEGPVVDRGWLTQQLAEHLALEQGENYDG